MIDYLTWAQIPAMLQMKYNPPEVTQIIRHKDEIRIHLIDRVDIWRHIEAQGPKSFSKWVKCS